MCKNYASIILGSHVQLIKIKSTGNSFLNKCVFNAMLLFGILLTGLKAEAQVSVSATAGTTSGSYATLSATFAAINAGTHQGAITISINANVTETNTSATLFSSGAGSASYTSVLVRPVTDGITITGNAPIGFGLIQLKGADNVIIDGDNPNTAGTNRNLTIINSRGQAQVGGSCIRIATVNVANASSANNITIKNCILNGNATQGNSSTTTDVASSADVSFGIFVGGNGGSTAIDALTAITTATNALAGSTTVNSLLIDNNEVNRCGRGIVFNGNTVSSSNGVTISNNLVGNQTATLSGAPPYTAPALTVYTKGIWVTGTNAVSITGNTVKNIISYVGDVLAGIELVSPIGTGTIDISSNAVSGVINNGTSSYARGILVSNTGTTPYTIASNDISNIQTVGGSGTIQPVGLEVTTLATSAIIERNSVSAVYSRTTSSWGSWGVNLNGGNNITFRNNILYDVKQDMTGGTTFSTANGVHGLRIAAGTGHKIYHNSISLSGTNFGTSAANLLSSAFTIVATTNTGIDVRNNIFSNTMSSSNAAAHVAMYLPSGATSSMNLILNNNAYYSGTTAARQGIAQVGTSIGTGFYLASNFVPGSTTGTTNLRNYTSTLLVANTTNDNASLGSTNAAPFSSATNLLLDMVSSQLVNVEQKGAAGLSVSTDIQGDARPNSGTTLPDMGADEVAIATSSVSNPATFTATTAAGVNSTSQISLTATANSNGNDIVVAFNATGTFTAPTNGTAPGAVGTALAGSGGTIAYVGTAAGLSSHSSLTANTPYFYKVFSYDGSNVFSTGSIANATTAKIEPTNQPTNFATGTITTSNISLSCTAAVAGSQAPDGYLVKLNTGAVTDPVDYTDLANSLAITGGAANARGTGVSFNSFTGAAPGTMYNYKIYSYTNSGSLINWNTTNPPSLSAATKPNVVTASSFTATSTTTGTIGWTLPTGYSAANNSILVFVKAGSSVTQGTPTNAPSTYTASTNFGTPGTAYQNDANAYCVYKGDGTSVSLTGLTGGITYNVLIYAVVDASNSAGGNSFSAAVAPTALIMPPVNDLCSGAIVIPNTSFPVMTAVQNNAGATTSSDAAPSCVSTSFSNDIWYSFTPSITGNYSISTCSGGELDTILSVFGGACGSTYDRIACADDVAPEICSTEFNAVIPSVSLTAGVTYYIVAYTYVGDSGAIQIEVNSIMPPTIDSFAPTGCAGSQLVITGTNLSGASTVSIGGVTVPIVGASTATSVTVTVGNSSGPIVVTCTNGIATSTTGFTSNPLPTTTWAASAASVCGSTGSQLTTLAYTSRTNTPDKYSITWNSSPANTFAAVTDLAKDFTAVSGSIEITIPANTATGTYTGTISVKNAAGCQSSGVQTFTVTVSSPPMTATGATICQNGSGALSVSATSVCPNDPLVISTVTGTNSNTFTLNNGANRSISLPVSNVPAGALITDVDVSVTMAHNYQGDVVLSLSTPGSTPTTVSLTGASGAGAGNKLGNTTATVNATSTGAVVTYTFDQSAATEAWGSNNPATAGSYKPASTFGAGSLDSFNGLNLINGNWILTAIDDATGDNGLITAVTVTIKYSLPGVINWYTSGNTVIGTGSSFNPVGAVGSGLTNTATPGTTTFYAACVSATNCKSFVDFVITPSVTIAPFSPATATRCQGAGTVTTTTTASNNTGNIVYSIDSTGAGNSIDSSTGAVTYAAGYSGTTTITATAAGCNGPVATTLTVTVTPSVTIAPFSPATATRCQGAGTVTTTTTASHNTGNIVYSIDSTGAGNSIDSSTGAVTYAAGYSGTTTITATAAGCNGPVSTALAVTVNPLQTPTVVLSSTDSDNTFAYGTSVTFTATASGVSGNTGIVYDFKVDGISRQSGSSNAFTTTAISDQQQVTVSIAVTGGTCMQASTANSNSITNTVSGAVLVHISNYCGQTLPFLTTPIYSSTAAVSGNPTVQYQFRVQKVGGASQTLALRSTPSFSLTQTSLYAYNTSFEVYVSAVINGIVQPESAACVITTPAIVPPATVQSTYCGSTLADAYSPIFAAPVPGATGYSFDVFQGSTRISTVVRDVNYFYLSNLPSWTYNTSYTVYVAVKINNEPFGSFGTVPCTVTTPQLSTPGLVACGTQMATVSSPVFTTTVPGATNYAFEITGPGVNGVIVNRSVPYFYLTSITNWNYGTSYTIKVRVTKGSEVGPQSAGCILTTPAIPSTAVRASQCDQLLANAATVIFADPVYGASNYVFKINDGTNPEFSLTRNVNYFSMTSVPTWEYNTVYTVTVQAVRNNSTSPVVTVCSITTPEGPFTTIQDGMCNNPTLTKSGSLTVDAHPNASSYNFFIEQYDENSQVVARYSKVVYTNSLLLSSVPGLPTPTNQEGVTYAWGVQVAVMGKYGEETKGCSFTLVPTPSGRMAETVFSATAYPNPFASNFMIDVKTKSQSVVNVKVYDMVGRLIEQRDVKATDLESAAIGNNYPSGVYNVVVAQDNNLETVRVIKR